MPKAWSAKRERQYEHIKEGLEDQGRSEDTAEQIAAYAERIKADPEDFIAQHAVGGGGVLKALRLRALIAAQRFRQPARSRHDEAGRMHESEQLKQVQRREPIGVEAPPQRLGVADQQRIALKAQPRLAQVDRLDLIAEQVAGGLDDVAHERHRPVLAVRELAHHEDRAASLARDLLGHAAK